MRSTELDWARDIEARAEACGLLTELGQAAMRRLRRAAIVLLEMRTEFEALGPDEVFEAGPRRGPMANLGFAMTRRCRRAAARGLDLWTGFAVLD